MFLIVTRNFPPDVGGIQSLMGGLSESLLNHGPVKVFAYESPNSNTFDNMLEWVLETVEFFKNNRHLKLIIKPHPHEINYFSEDSKKPNFSSSSFSLLKDVVRRILVIFSS